MPVLSVEKTTTGSVNEEGPEAKLAITRSSIDSVKAKIHEAKSAGLMRGSVIEKKTCFGLAPRSRAASSKKESISKRRARTIRLT